MINKKFVERKISLIGEELERLKKFSEYTFEDIVSDFRKQAIVERVLERVINRAIDINQHLLLEMSTKEVDAPKSYRETFLELVKIGVYPEAFAKNLAKSVGMRNILVHEYDKVDYSIIYSSIRDCLEDYHKYCQYVLDFLDNQE